MKLQNEITVAGPNGVKVSIDVTKLKLTKAQKAALAKVVAADFDLKSLSKEESEALAKAKATLGSGTQAVLVRFDWKWFRID